MRYDLTFVKALMRIYFELGRNISTCFRKFGSGYTSPI